MALFDKLKGIAKDVSKTVTAVSKDVSKTVTAVSKSVANDLSKLGNSSPSEEERQKQRERDEAIRRASAEHKARVERQQQEAAEAQKRAEEQAEAERKEKMEQRKAQRKQYVPTITAPEDDSGSGVCFQYGDITYCSTQGDGYEKLLYPESFEYALRLYALSNALPGSECDSYEEITSEFVEAFMPAYADAADSFTSSVKKWGIGESNPKLKLFQFLPNRPATMKLDHINGILGGFVYPPKDPEDAAYYFEKLVAVLRKKNTYYRTQLEMNGMMLVLGVYYHKGMREHLFTHDGYCCASEEDLFDEDGLLKDTGSKSFAYPNPGFSTLFSVLATWVDISTRLKNKHCKQCGACVHWKGEREKWSTLHAVLVEPETKAVCALFTIPENNTQAITVAEDTCNRFEPCDACEGF